MARQRSRRQRDEQADHGGLAERHRQAVERVGVLVPELLHRLAACGTVSFIGCVSPSTRSAHFTRDGVVRWGTQSAA